MLPFYFMGWVECIAYTAYDWLFTDILNNFVGGDPVGFLQNINNHLQTAKENRLIYIEKTGHTYQQKHQETADTLLKLIKDWRK